MADIEKIKVKGTDYTVVDSTVPSHVRSITQQNITDWNGKQDELTVGNGIAIDNSDTIRAIGIPFGIVDGTSTKTAFTATVPGINRLEDGVCVLLKNGVVTSASGFTININGLGAKPCYSNMAAATAETTLFNINYTILFVYDSTRVTGGCWIYYRGYYTSSSNSIGYQLRCNNTVQVASDTSRYYKIFFTSADGTKLVPASVNSTNNATTARPVNQRPINPFGRIAYTSANTNYTAGSNVAAATLWDQYPLVLGYSFNRTGADLTLTAKAPVYVKCAPQSDGSAIMDADIPIVQTLPSTADGKIYIFLGIAYDATHIELFINHPVYYHDGTGIRLWAGSSGGSSADLTNYYTKTEVDTALGGKQATLVSGTNLKTVNDTSLLGSGNVSVQPTLVSGTNIKTINNESLLGSGNITISGGGGGSVQSDWNQTDTTADDYIKNKPDVLPISYDANTTTLVIGVSSGYTITFDSSLEDITFLDSENNIIDKTSPVLVASSSSFYCRTASSRYGTVLDVTMDNVNISSSVVTDHIQSDGPIDEFWYEISIPSVTGNVVISKHI